MIFSSAVSLHIHLSMPPPAHRRKEGSAQGKPDGRLVITSSDGLRNPVPRR